MRRPQSLPTTSQRCAPKYPAATPAPCSKTATPKMSSGEDATNDNPPHASAPTSASTRSELQSKSAIRPAGAISYSCLDNGCAQFGHVLMLHLPPVGRWPSASGTSFPSAPTLLWAAPSILLCLAASSILPLECSMLPTAHSIWRTRHLEERYDYYINDHCCNSYSYCFWAILVFTPIFVPSLELFKIKSATCERHVLRFATSHIDQERYFG